jgi:peptide/nickel transport system substrate-binding protein
MTMHLGFWQRGRRLGALLMAGLASLILVAGCGSSSTTSPSSSNGGGSSSASFYTGWPTGGTPVRGGTLTVAEAEATNTLNPYEGTTGQQPTGQIFDELVELLPGKGSEPKLEPGLATSWTISPNHLVYTFHLREGVHFSNGETVTGEDVAFSLKQTLLPTSPGQSLTTDWKRVSLAGPMTVQIELVKPQVTLLENLDTFFFAIVPKAVYQREGAKAFGLHPIGTGPFMIAHVSPGFAEIALKRNPHYWRSGEPYLNEIVFKLVESDNSRVLAVRSGAAQLGASIPYAQAASLRATPGVKMLIGPEWGASYNWFNRAKAPFNEIDVRRALMYATPREEIIKSVYKGLGTPANSPWGRLRYWDSKVPYYPYDLAKAKELLKASSVPHGFNMTIEVTGGETGGQLLASILQSSWARIGVHASIDSLSSAALSSNFFSGKYNFTVWPPLAGYSLVFDPDAAAKVYFTTSESGFGPPASKEFVAMTEKASTATDEAERARLFGEMQYDAYQKEALFMPVVDLVSLNLVGDSVRGLEVLPNTFIRMEQVWLQQ